MLSGGAVPSHPDRMASRGGQSAISATWLRRHAFLLRFEKEPGRLRSTLAESTRKANLGGPRGDLATGLLGRAVRLRTVPQ